MKQPEINKYNILDLCRALKEHNAIVDIDGKEIRVISKCPLRMFVNISPDVARIVWDRFAKEDYKARADYRREDGKTISYNIYRWKVKITQELYAQILENLTAAISKEEQEYLEEDARILNEFIYGK